MKELGKDKALIINTIASFVTFVVGLGIAFFFTPFLTDTVGEEAYGFVSLGNYNSHGSAELSSGKIYHNRISSGEKERSE